MDIINEWDTDTKKEEIKNIKRNFLKWITQR
jgi:hypothetical protein